jgi:proline dehydrogenase
MSVLRKAVLAVSNQKRIEKFVTTSAVVRPLVDRFVAGESLDTAIAVTHRIAADGMTVTLDQLGEDISSAGDATAAVATYQEMLHRLQADGLEPNISVKLTMLGLDIDRGLAAANLRALVETASTVSGFVRVDMEGSAHTQATIDVFEEVHDAFPGNVGIVLQSYLKRTDDDVRAMIDRGARVRLVKGAYAEPESVAYASMAEIREKFIGQMRQLLEHGNYPAIATHDESLIAATKAYAAAHAWPADRFEFQMLYGMRRDDQKRLVREGYRMRIYVPFGTEWYPYFTRRIAERPANALFVLRNLRG